MNMVGDESRRRNLLPRNSQLGSQTKIIDQSLARQTLTHPSHHWQQLSKPPLATWVFDSIAKNRRISSKERALEAFHHG